VVDEVSAGVEVKRLIGVGVDRASRRMRATSTTARRVCSNSTRRAALAAATRTESDRPMRRVPEWGAAPRGLVDLVSLELSFELRRAVSSRSTRGIDGKRQPGAAVGQVMVDHKLLISDLFSRGPVTRIPTGSGPRALTHVTQRLTFPDCPRLATADREPASTVNHRPVMYDAASEARKTAAPRACRAAQSARAGCGGPARRCAARRRTGVLWSEEPGARSHWR